VARTKLNFRLTSLRVAYGLKDGQKGELNISRFLIKNLNFDSSTAFELASQMDFKLPEKKSLGLDALVIGDINLSELVKSEKFTLQTVLTLGGFRTTGIPVKIPDIKTEVKALVDKKGTVLGDVTTTFNGRNKISSKYQVSKQKIDLTDLNINLHLSDLMEMAAFQNPALKADNAVFVMKGALSVVMIPGKPMPNIDPDLKFSIDPGIGFSVGDISGTSKLVGLFKGTQFEVSSTNDLLGGSAGVTAKTKLDLNKGNFSPQNLGPFDIDVRLTKLTLTKEAIQKTLYAKAKKEGATSEDAGKTEGGDQSEAANAKTPPPGPLPVLPPGKITLNFNEIQVDKEQLAGQGEILITKDSVATKFLRFKYSEGKGELTHLTKLAREIIKSTFNFKLNGLDLNGISPFLPPKLEGIEGTFSGTIGGSVDLIRPSKVKYDVSVDVLAQNGQIKGFKPGEMLAGLTSSLPFLKGQADKKLDLDNAFEKLTLKGQFKDTVYNLNSFNFIGIKKKVEMTGNGTVYPPPITQQGSVTMDLTDNSGVISAPLEKYAGTKILPLRLTGTGFALKPDYEYTMGKLAKGALKSPAVKEAAQKMGEKLIKDENVQKLFKGFFKK